jgi:hypothetical protein
MGMGMHLLLEHVDFEFVTPCWVNIVVVLFLGGACVLGMGIGEFQNCLANMFKLFQNYKLTCLTFLYKTNPKVFLMHS